MNANNGYRWNILGLATFCILTFGIIFQSIPPLIGILVDVLNVSYARAGALMGLFTFASIFLSLPGGMLADRYGARNVGRVAMVSMALGTAIVALGGDYWVVALGRLVAGIGAAVLLVVAPKIITTWFLDREIGLSMGIFNIAMPLGTILALNFMGVIAYRFSWQTSIWISFAVGVVALCLFLVLYRSRKTDGEIAPEPAGLLAMAKQAGGGVWLVGISWGLFNAGIISFFTYAPDYFVSRGADISKAGLLASYPMWGSIVLAPLVGMLIDRLGIFDPALYPSGRYALPFHRHIHRAVDAGDILIAGRAFARTHNGLRIRYPGNHSRHWNIGGSLYCWQLAGCHRRLPVEFRRNGDFFRIGHRTDGDT
jgi:cyanate permease